MTHKTLLLVLCLLPVLLTGCQQEPETVQKSEMLFDTIVTIELYDVPEEEGSALLDDCFALGQYYEALFSRTADTSEIYALNHAGGNPVTVSDETILLLETGIWYGELTDGSFDISIAAVSDLWDFSPETAVIPDDDTLAAAVATVDYRQIDISGNTATLADPGMQLDLGGIAKGYIADKMKEFLADAGVTSAVLNLGGDVVTLGIKPDNSSWNIGIQKPFDDQNSVIAAASLQDQAIVSSGSYERYFELDETIYHHILNPATGYPVSNDLTSVTVISDSGIDGDALSTACFVLGLDAGLDLINSLDAIEAVFITTDNTLYYSDGINRPDGITVSETAEQRQARFANQSYVQP